MEKTIIDLLNNYDIYYVSIPKESLENIHELLTKDKKFKPTTDIDILYIGVYWNIKHNFKKMIKYLSFATDLKNIIAMINLGSHYKSISKFDDAIKYYSMAFANTLNFVDIIKYCPMYTANSYSIIIHNVAYCYEKVSKFDDAVKYYLMSIEYGNTYSMNNLARYYEIISKIDDAIRYYLLAIENDSIDAMINLAYCYEKILKFKDAIKYYSMAIERGSKFAHIQVDKYYLNKNIYDIYDIFDEHFFVYLKFERYELASLFRDIKNMYANTVKILILHFEYSPETDRFNEIKKDFEKRKIRI